MHWLCNWVWLSDDNNDYEPSNDNSCSDDYESANPDTYDTEWYLLNGSVVNTWIISKLAIFQILVMSV